jgi:hypothetical protein
MSSVIQCGVVGAWIYRFGHRVFASLNIYSPMSASRRLAGLKYPMGPRLADFYNVDAWRRGQIVDDRISTELRLNHKDNPPVQSPKSRRRKGAQDK